MKKELTIKELETILTEASNAYYNTDERVISDEEFDTLEKEYFVRTGNKFVGASPIEGKGTINVSHNYANLVGTLSKCKNIEDFREWLTGVTVKLGRMPKELYVTLKYDGNSIVIEYSNGKVEKVLTRGKEGKGLDLTHVFKDYHELEYLTEEVGIKYEVVMLYKDFNDLMKAENISYANPRSIVAGKLGCDNAVNYTEYFTLVPLWMRYKDRDLSRTEQNHLLSKEFGTEYCDLVGDYNASIVTADIDEACNQLNKVYQNVINMRENLPFMIDGLVIECCRDEDRKILGENTNYPNWATALKFPYMEKDSVVTGFDYCLGDSGRITPRVFFKPVDFNGTVHTKQSLQNYARYKELDLRVGSDIIVSYNNDCLTYVERKNNDNNKLLSSTIPMDNILCPVCGSIASPNETGAFLYCPNELCEGKICGKLQNYLTKMDIKGIKINMLEAFKEAGLVNSIIDLYTMDYSKIANVDRMGVKVANNVKKAIQSKVPYDYEILGSLGIPNCSRSTSKEIFKKHTLKEVMENNDLKTLLMDVEGIADITANYIIEGIADNRKTIEFLMSRPYTEFKSTLANATDKPEVIVFTGFRDKALQAALELKGHKITGSVSKNTTIVVTPDPDGSSSKIKKAKDLGITILTVEEFKSKYN